MKAFIVLALLNFIGLCEAGVDNKAANPVPLRALFWYLPDSLDPYKAGQFSLLPLARNIYAPLVSTYMDGTPQGMIAESWTVSADGRTWRFLPRKGLTFQDGTAVTAAAIVSNFRRILWLTREENQALNALLPELKAWRRYNEPLKTLYEDHGEAVFVFNKRPKNLFEAISQPIYSIADPKCFNDRGEWLEPFCAGGSGEYLIAERTPDKITLKARHVFKSAEKAPEIVEMLVPTAKNSSPLKLMMQGGVDLAIKTSLDVDAEFLEMVKPAGMRQRKLPAFRMNFAVLNPFRTPFSDPELRRSFRDAFQERLRADPLFTPDTRVDASFIPKGAMGYTRMPSTKRRKPVMSHAGETVTVFLNKKAANLLKKKRVLGTILSQAVVDALELHGLKLNVVDPYSVDYWGRMQKGEYDLLLHSSVISAENPFESLRTLFMRGKLEGLPVTSGDIGANIEKADASSDPAQRRELAEKINRAIFEEAAIVTYAHSGLVYLFNPQVDLSRCSMFLSPIEFRAVSWAPRQGEK